MNDNEKITEDEMSNALFRSGYLLESRLLKILSDIGYELHPNEGYPDPITRKSREIDILGNSPRTTANLHLDKYLSIDVKHSIIVECSNNPQPAVFFKRTDKTTRTIFEKFKYNKIEQPTNEDGHSVDFEFHTYTTESKDFHYNKLNRCSQYCSFMQKKNSSNSKKEWFATHPDGLHDVFNKLYDFVNHNYQSNEDWIQSTYKKSEVYLNLYYPVIVLQGELYEAIEENGKLNLTSVNQTLFEFIRYENNSTALLIDIVTESYFPEYLKTINTDMANLKKLYVDFYTGKTLLEKDDLPF